MAQANLVGAGAGPVMVEQHVQVDKHGEYMKNLIRLYHKYRNDVHCWENCKSCEQYDISSLKKKIRREKERLRDQFWDNPKKAEFYCSNGVHICNLTDQLEEKQKDYQMTLKRLERDRPILTEIVNRINAIQKTEKLKSELITRVQLRKMKKELMARSQLHPYRIAECLENGDHEELDRYLDLVCN